jgi:hypothetical protein
MGKTYKDSAGSRSESYNENKHRGFVRKMDHNSHHSLRNKNRNADELTFNKLNKSNHWMNNIGYVQPSNIPHYNNYYNRAPNKSSYIDDIIIEKFDGDKFDGPKRNNESIEYNIKKYINQHINDKQFRCDDNYKYLTASLKQIERRGEIREFYGMKNERDLKYAMNHDI